MRQFLRKNKYIIGISLGSIVVGSLLAVVGAPVVGAILIVGGVGGCGFLAYRVLKN